MIRKKCRLTAVAWRSQNSVPDPQTIWQWIPGRRGSDQECLTAVSVDLIKLYGEQMAPGRAILCLYSMARSSKANDHLSLLLWIGYWDSV